MRVLWFTNIPMPAVDRRTGKQTLGSGHWMSTLLQQVRRRPGMQLGIATAYPGLRDDEFTDDGVEYFVVGQPRWLSHLAARETDIEKCRAVVEKFQPDVVHFHGCERFFGLLASRRLIPQPSVISLQGVLSAYLPTFFGALSWTDVLAAHRLSEVLTRRGLLWSYLVQHIAARREREILHGAHAFLGRTAWDRAIAERFNVNAPYFHVGEMLREQFRTGEWSLSGCRRRVVMLNNAGHPRRGVEVVLDAIAQLAREYSDVELWLSGGVSAESGYGRFLLKRVERLGLVKRVRFLGFLSADALAGVMKQVHVYVLSSFAENSPNALCEAQLVGVPCVASYAGGVPSLVEDGITGLLFPVGDAAMLASRLRRVFEDDALATRLSLAARAEAARRHEPETIVTDLVSAYEKVAAAGRSSMRARAPARRTAN